MSDPSSQSYHHSTGQRDRSTIGLVSMERIRPLSETVHSAVRSGFIISGLTTVVEELIYNSLDAGATKVTVYVGVSNGYVKVEDDGYGISRDGLVLLGERYATSKLHHLQDKDDDVQSFGFRGEVLCSIADTSLIEFITKVQGRPNGYHKVMKGRKCLYLSIDDGRQDVGTTVIVRDLFYNQPVRRRQMQSSAKKVLHSVKKCTVRIALVHPRVSFKVVDMESEVELLRTHSSFSPLTVLCRNFGFDASSLHELTFSQGSLNLRGYVSGPSSSFSMKAIQYIYVNSRFIVKGPIHKALNRLADMCWEQLSGDGGGKRGHSHMGPTYCLNLTCPRSCYDLNLEFSRTAVEFKDWALVLAFIEKAVSIVWRKRANKGDSYNGKTHQTGAGGTEKLVKNMITPEKGEDKDAVTRSNQLLPDADWLLKTCLPTKRRKIESIQNEQLSAKSSLKPTEMLVEDGSLSLCQGINSRGRNFLRNPANFGEEETDGEFPYQMDSSESRGASPVNCIFDVGRSIDDCLLETDKELKSLDGLSENFVSNVQRDYDNGDHLHCSRREDGPRVDTYARNSEAGKGWGCEFGLQDDQLQALSSDIPTTLKYNKSPIFQIRDTEANGCSSNFISKTDAYSLSHNFSSIQKLQSQNGAARNWPLSKLCIESDMWEGCGITSMKCHDSFSLYSESFDQDLALNLPSEQVRVFSPCLSPYSDQHMTTSYPVLNTKPWDHEYVIQDHGLERRSKVRNCDAFGQSKNDKEGFYHDDLGDTCFYENSFTAHLDSDLIFMNEYAGAKRGTSEFSNHAHSVNGIFSEDLHFTCIDRRERNHGYCSSVCWSPKSIDIEAQIDGRKREALNADHISGGRMRRGDRDCSPADLFLACSGDILSDGVFSPFLNFQSKYDAFTPSFPLVSSMSTCKGPKIDRRGCEAPQQNYRLSRQTESSSRSKRSHSAPPVYRAKRRFFSIVDYLISTAESPGPQVAPRACNVTERGELEHSTDSPLFNGQLHERHDMSHVNDSPFCSKQMGKETSNITQISKRAQVGTSSCNPGDLKPVQDSETSLIKWREDCIDGRPADIVNSEDVGEGSNQLKDENTILDIDSCMLHVAGDSLVPKSITRTCLENANVLLQVDKKFIPVVAGGTLAVIDQHAADERIRLEEMRKKVLSGEMKSITYLEEEKDLVLPEMAYQLLCSYAEHVQHWGWICNIFCQDSGPFNKDLNLLNRKPMHLSLLAVPCIVGVNLSDADLLEFLEQLADTDGSSTIPPAILRILNYKACRGAIMFGDKLLPSECNLIVEELKHTSLCFQCAHGRPTTVPLVNLEALHKSIAQLGSWHEGPQNSWHGLCRKEISLERAKRRLDVATSHG